MWISKSLRGELGLMVFGVGGLLAAAFVACASDGASSADGSTGGASNGNDASTSSGAATSTGGSSATKDSGNGTSADCSGDASDASHTQAVVTAANALLDLLTTDQKTAIAYDLTLTNAAQWSNFPTTFVQRNGVRIGDMSTDAQNAAVALAEVAAGTTGSALLDEVREADEFLVTDGKASSTDYGRGLYYFSIHGTPSSSAPWMLQIAGHHLAYNFMYGSKCAGATPLFDGVEPTTWSDSSGKEHAPLEAQRAAMVALLSSVGSGALLSGTFGDLVNGPAGGGPGGGGGGDTKYPASLVYPTGTAGRGAPVSSMTAAQKALVKTAIEAWVENAAEPVADALLASYESDDALAETYVGYSGSPDLTTASSYVRIDGPRVWIEVTIQGGIVYRDRVHYHTIWRDKVADYGAEFVEP